MENVSNDISLNNTIPDESKINLLMATSDIVESAKDYKLWHYLAMTEMRRRYRRTVIGPFWTTLSIGIFILVMSIVLSGLWSSNPRSFLPYFCVGYINWILISSLITEGCTTFIANEMYLKQLSIPYTIYAFLTTWKNYLVFFHHMIIFAIVLLVCKQPINLNIIFVIPGLILTFITGTIVCMLLGMLCARYRDIQQVISSMLQLAMFVTPIMWKPDQLGRKGYIITMLNPIYHFISLIRLPLLGQIPPIESWLIAISFMIILAGITFTIFSKKYRSIIFWI